VLDQERRASYAFLDQVLRERADRAFVVQLDMCQSQSSSTKCPYFADDHLSDTGVKTLRVFDAPK